MGRSAQSAGQSRPSPTPALIPAVSRNPHTAAPQMTKKYRARDQDVPLQPHYPRLLSPENRRGCLPNKLEGFWKQDQD